MSDPFAVAHDVAEALLWEGYVLYPYRATAAKNQLRWQFGVLTPQAYSEADGHERWRLTTDCLYAATPASKLELRVRFLRAQHRSLQIRAGDEWREVDSVERGGVPLITWDEGVPATVDSVGAFVLPAWHGVEAVDDDTRVVRDRQELRGVVRVTTTEVCEGFAKVRLEIENTTQCYPTAASRDGALARSLIAAHALLRVVDGTFVSSLDPPEAARTAVENCENDGAYPVLIGPVDAPLVLATPILLDDFPAVAPRSPGDMFDSTEIDEILALRVLLLTEQEKRVVRGTDARAAAIVDRVEKMSADTFASLHAELESPGDDTVVVGGRIVQRGSRVRLRPGALVGRRTDAQDLFLIGMAATVAEVVTDLEGERYVAVVVDGDADFGLHADVGRYRYFYPDEVEPL